MSVFDVGHRGTFQIMASLAGSAELTQSLAAVAPLTLALFALVTNIGPSTAPSIDSKQRRQFRTAEKNLQDTKDNLFREMGAFRAELEVINMPPRERFGFGAGEGTPGN